MTGGAVGLHACVGTEGAHAKRALDAQSSVSVREPGCRVRQRVATRIIGWPRFARVRHAEQETLHSEQELLSGPMSHKNGLVWMRLSLDEVA